MAFRCVAILYYHSILEVYTLSSFNWFCSWIHSTILCNFYTECTHLHRVLFYFVRDERFMIHAFRTKRGDHEIGLGFFFIQFHQICLIEIMALVWLVQFVFINTFCMHHYYLLSVSNRNKYLIISEHLFPFCFWKNFNLIFWLSYLYDLELASRSRSKARLV